MRKWVGVQGPIEKMIETPRLGTPPPEFEEPDLYDYGVERILVVQHDLLVDLFVLNGLHAEQRMLGGAIAEGVAIAEVLPAVGPGYGDGGMGFG